VRLADGHQQGVELVEESRIGRQMRFEERPRLLVAGAGPQQPVARQHAARVGVGDEHGTPGGVQQDRVHGLRSQAAYPEQLPAQRTQRRAAHAPEVAAEADQQPPREVEQGPRLEPVGPGGTDQAGQRGVIARGQATRGHQATGAQGADGASGAGPGGVLRQDRPDGHLERRAGRPPALRPVPRQQPPVQPQQAGFDPIARRPGNRAPRGQHRTA